MAAHVAALQRRAARLLEPRDLRVDLRDQLDRRSAVQRQAARRALRRPLLLSDCEGVSGDAVPRRFPRKDELSRSVYSFAYRIERQLRDLSAEPQLLRHDRL